MVIGFGNMKVQTGIRVDKLVSVRFKDLCRAEKLMVGLLLIGLYVLA